MRLSSAGMTGRVRPCARLRDVPVPDRGNLADLVRAAAASRPDHPALRTVAGDSAPAATTTWAELDRDVDALAAGMVATLPLRPGDRVALMLSNTPAFVLAYFALLRAGAVAVPVNTGYTAPEVAALLGSAEARAVICEDATIGVVEEAVAETDRVVVDPSGLDALLAAGRGAGPVEQVAGGEDLAVLMFTSGTSGRPRAAMLSHRALRANLRQCLDLDPSPVQPDDVVLLVLPLFHIYGLNAGLGLVAATGSTAVLTERFDPVQTLEAVRTHGVTSVPGAPPMYVAWAEAGSVEALREVRMLASGASPLPPSVLAAVQAAAGRPVHEGYGLTETAPVVSTTLASERVKPGSIGRPVPGVQVRLRDEDGAAVQDGDPGEIWVRGDNLFSGYWPEGSEGPDESGWWGTGDVAYADGDGDLFLVDRRKELVLVSGFNVYPREVEDAIEEHADVLEAAVIAVADPRTGEAVKAFVVARPGSGLTAEDVTAHATTRLARFKRPTTVVLVDELPHSATGKVAKGRLREAQ
jgi:long-chain acyl-CoA synthetase